jgi:hypothetical protein
MSISPFREAKRLDITTTAVVKTTESITRIRKQIAEAEGFLAALNEKRTAMMLSRDSNPEVDLVVAANESIARYEQDMEPQVLILLTLRADLMSQDMDLAALLVKQNLQTQAFRRQEADYPAALKRHLRRCKKFGWTDSRLAGARK